MPAKPKSPTSHDLEKLLRQTRRSANLDYVKWWTEGTTAPLSLSKVIQLGNVVTMHDATPARLRRLPSGALRCRLIALELSIDFTAKHHRPGVDRDRFDQTVFRQLVSRLDPAGGKYMSQKVGISPGVDQYLPLLRTEVVRDVSGHTFLRDVGTRVAKGRLLLERAGMNAGTIYFGEDNRDATSAPASDPVVQVKVYRKVPDHDVPLPAKKHRIRLEVTLNARALDDLFDGPVTVAQLPDLSYRDLVNQYLRLVEPTIKAATNAPYRRKATPPTLTGLLALIRRRREELSHADAERAAMDGNFVEAGNSTLEFRSLRGPTDVLREAADNLRAKLIPVKNDWDLRA